MIRFDLNVEDIASRGPGVAVGRRPVENEKAAACGDAGGRIGRSDQKPNVRSIDDVRAKPPFAVR